MSNEAGGKHYGKGLQPWDLQRDMQSWGSVFVDARRTDAMEYLFRKKGDRSKQLDDAKKALHNVQVIIEELEKEDPQTELPLETCTVKHTLENAKYLNFELGICMICEKPWPENQFPVVRLIPNEP